jgi:hypothetical protein
MYSEGWNAGIDATRRDKDMRKPRRELTDEKRRNGLKSCSNSFGLIDLKVFEGFWTL